MGCFSGGVLSGLTTAGAWRALGQPRPAGGRRRPAGAASLTHLQLAVGAAAPHLAALTLSGSPHAFEWIPPRLT
eukprot:COSAG01_NODE_58_length_30193_cov_12.302020_2_plen_74_part_00